MKKTLFSITLLIGLFSYSQHHIIDVSHNFNIAGDYKDFYKDYAILGYTYKSVDKTINHGVNVEIGVSQFYLIDSPRADFGYFSQTETTTTLNYSLNYIASKDFDKINIFAKTGFYIGAVNNDDLLIAGLNISLGTYYKLSNNINAKVNYNYKFLTSWVGIAGAPEPKAHQINIGLAYSL